jgi:hypothetical protein
MLLLVVPSFATSAQTGGGVCPGVVNQALAQLGTNCANMGRNNACYGFNNVEADFNVPVPEDFFTTTDERAELLTVNALKTGPLDLGQNQWGVSILNVQANIPDALPGQGVVFVLMGGVEVESDVLPEEAVIPATTLESTVTIASELRSTPNTPEWLASEIIGSVALGTSVSADAIDPTSDWVRVVVGTQVGWISASALSGDLSSLTVVGADSRTPMQAFFFRVGIGGVSCEEVPSLLAVQGPRDTAIEIEVNRVNVRVTSTIILQTFPPGDTLGDILQLSVISGLAYINPDTPEQVVVPPGFTTFISLAGELQDLGTEGDADEKVVTGEWAVPRPLTQEELARFRLLEQVPGNLLNYSITIPTVQLPSGIGSPEGRLIVVDQGALNGARRVCEAELLPEFICEYLGL